MWIRPNNNDSHEWKRLYAAAFITFCLTGMFFLSATQLIIRASLPHLHPALWGAVLFTTGAGLLATGAWLLADKEKRTKTLYMALGGLLIGMALWGWGSLNTWTKLQQDRHPFQTTLEKTLPSESGKWEWQYRDCPACVLPRDISWVGQTTLTVHRNGVTIPVVLLAQQPRAGGANGTITVVYSRGCTIVHGAINDRWRPGASPELLRRTGHTRQCIEQYQVP